MGRKRFTSGQIISMLREAEVLQSKGLKIPRWLSNVPVRVRPLVLGIFDFPEMPLVLICLPFSNHIHS